MTAAIALTIAGSTPVRAGIQADLKSLLGARRLYGASGDRGASGARTRGVSAVLDIPPAFVTAQDGCGVLRPRGRAVQASMLAMPVVSKRCGRARPSPPDRIVSTP